MARMHRTIRPDAHAIAFTAAHEARLLPPAGPDQDPIEPDEVVGRTLATLVSPGTEVQGHYVRSDRRFPYHPGYAAVFLVEAVGPEVTDIAPGQRVFCTGYHASRQRMARSSVVAVPDNVDSHHAPFARLAGVSMTSLVTTAARPPGRVFVTGLGLVGHLAAQVFRIAGYQVAGADPNAAVRRIACDKALDALDRVPVDDADHHRQYDLVLECAGHEQAVLDACQLLRHGGEMALIGAFWRQQTDLSMHPLLRTVFHHFLTIRSGWEYEIPWHRDAFDPGSIFENYAAALRWLDDGRLDVAGLYDVASPHDAQRVYQNLANRQQPALSTVFDWTQL